MKTSLKAEITKYMGATVSMWYPSKDEPVLHAEMAEGLFPNGEKHQTVEFTRYDTDWNWMHPVWDKLRQEKTLDFTSSETVMFLNAKYALKRAMLEGTPEQAFICAYNAIKHLKRK